MAKEVYPFAYIIQGDFAGMYVYYQDYDDNYFVRPESVYKDGLFSSGLWYNANYRYKFRDIIGYEDIGNATHSADAASVIKGGLVLGVVGAMAASAAGAGTTYDTVIYFKDAKKCVFRFLNSQVHQNHITSFHQLHIKPGNPAVMNTNTARKPTVNSSQTGRKLPSTPPKKPDVPQNIQKPKDCVEDISQIDPNRIYNLYCIGIVRDKITGVSHANTTLVQYGYSNPNEALGKILMKAVPGSKVIKKMKSRDGVCYGAVPMISANQPVSHSIVETSQKQDGCLTKDTPESHEEKPIACNSLSYIEELKQLKELVDLGIITQEEFDIKKKQLLGL